MGREEPVDIPEREGRVGWMKEVSAGWAEPFRGIVQDIFEPHCPHTIWFNRFLLLI